MMIQPLFNKTKYYIEDLNHQIAHKCRFCNPPDKERILYESKNFYVMLSLGPIVEGYLLVVSKDHLDCCAVYDPELGAEFDELVASVKSILTKEYGGCICYEHGQAGDCLMPANSNRIHCYHSHMHFIPLNVKLSSLIDCEFNPIILTSLENFRKRYQTYPTPYLFVNDGEMKMYNINKIIRSQYLRYKLASLVGKDNLWDWITYQGWESIYSAKHKLGKYFNP